MRRIFTLTTVFLALAMIAGCTNWERNTFQALSASKATIDQAQLDYEGGTLIPHNQAAYTVINKAKAAQTAAVNAMVVYEQLKANNAGTDALTKAQADVATLLGDLPSLITAIKGLYTTGGK